MAGDFKGVAEKFRLSLAHHDGSTERVVVQIGLDGLRILDAGSGRAMRTYELSHISRWQSRGSSLVLYTRTPVDVEERQTTLQGDDNAIRSALDTLTCCCMQLAEILQSKQTTEKGAQETANSLHALVVGGGKKKTPLPSADEIEYWKNPDKAGWLQCQGETFKSWRQRWFVLKQGYLYRFFNDRVTESQKPRGVVDLSKIQDIKVLPGRSNTIQLKTTSGGTVCYMASTETEVVEWVSALEAAVAKICKHAANVEGEDAAAAAKSAGGSSAKKATVASAPAAGGSSAGHADWLAKELERNFSSGFNASAASTSGRSHGPSGNSAPTMVNIVGYEPGGGGGGGGQYGGSSAGNGGASSGYQQREPYRVDTSPYASLNKQYSSGYSAIQGANIAGASAVSDLDLNYGGPIGGGGGTAQQPQPQLQHQPSYGSSAPASLYGQASGGNGGYYGAAPAASGYGMPAAAAAGPPPLSLMDQVPQQQPAYPYFHQQQQAQPVVQQAAPAPAPGGGSPWQVHYTGEGRPYYYNGATGITTWEAPMGFA